MDYEAMLEGVRNKMFMIEDVSLVDIGYNAQWLILRNMENELIKLIKLERENDN